MTRRATCGFCVVFQSVRLVGARIVFADRRARLDRVGQQAVVDEVEPGDVVGRLERGLGGLLVSQVPLIDGVARRDLVDLRRAVCPAPWPDRSRPAAAHNRCRSSRRRPWPVPASRRRTTATASPTWFALPCASAGCGAIFICEPSLDVIIQPQMRLPILSPASSAPVRTASTPGIFAAAAPSIVFDPGVGMGRAKEVGVALPRTIDVVGVVTLAGDEALVLFAAHRRTDSGCAHGGLLPG